MCWRFYTCRQQFFLGFLFFLFLHKETSNSLWLRLMFYPEISLPSEVLEVSATLQVILLKSCYHEQLFECSFESDIWDPGANADLSSQGAPPHAIFKEAKIFQRVQQQLLRRTKNPLYFEELRTLVPEGSVVHIAPSGDVLTESSSHQDPCLYILGVQAMFNASNRYDPKVFLTALAPSTCGPLIHSIDSSRCERK